MKSTLSLALLSVAVVLVRADVPIYGQCGGIGYTGETKCASGATCVYSNDYYSQCVASSGGGSTTSTSKTTTSTSKTTTSTSKTTTTTTKATTTTNTATSTAGGGAYTTKLPASSGYVALPTPSTIKSGQTFDGKMYKYDRKGSSGECQGQTETGEDDAVFIVEAGGTVQNVIIGKDQAEGIHCKGACTIRNVWWEDVCEDALTIEQTGSGDTSYVIGGGAFHAEDKIVQHNGAGTVSISGFYASDFGKLYRACGNCKTHYERHVVIDNVCLASGSTGVGINTNWGDTAKLTNIKTSGGKPSAANLCCTYTGVASGSEPPKIGCGDSYSACQYSQSSIGSC